MDDNIDIAILNYQMWFSWYSLKVLKKVYRNLSEKNTTKEWYFECLWNLGKIIEDLSEEVEAMDNRFIPK